MSRPSRGCDQLLGRHVAVGQRSVAGPREGGGRAERAQDVVEHAHLLAVVGGKVGADGEAVLGGDGGDGGPRHGAGSPDEDLRHVLGGGDLDRRARGVVGGYLQVAAPPVRRSAPGAVAPVPPGHAQGHVGGAVVGLDVGQLAAQIGVVLRPEAERIGQVDVAGHVERAGVGDGLGLTRAGHGEPDVDAHGTAPHQQHHADGGEDERRSPLVPDATGVGAGSAGAECRSDAHHYELGLESWSTSVDEMVDGVMMPMPGSKGNSGLEL